MVCLNSPALQITGFSRAIVDSAYGIDFMDDVRRIAKETAPGLQAFAYGLGFLSTDGGCSVVSWLLLLLLLLLLQLGTTSSWPTHGP